MRPAALALALGTLAPGSLGGIIPYTSTGCTGWQLDECAVEQAKDRFIEWGQHNKVGAGKVMWYDDDNHSVSWWICNCKKYWGDHVVPEELDDVLDILYEKCGGEYRSGWGKQSNAKQSKPIFFFLFFSFLFCFSFSEESLFIFFPLWVASNDFNP